MGQIFAINDVFEYGAGFLCTEEHMLCRNVSHQFDKQFGRLISPEQMKTISFNMRLYAARHNVDLFMLYPPVYSYMEYAVAIKHNFNAGKFLIDSRPITRSQVNAFANLSIKYNNDDILKYLISNYNARITHDMQCSSANRLSTFLICNENFVTDPYRGYIYTYVICENNIEILDYLKNEKNYCDKKSLYKLAINNDYITIFAWLFQDAKNISSICYNIVKSCNYDCVMWLIQQNDRAKKNKIIKTIIKVIYNKKIAKRFIDLNGNYVNLYAIGAIAEDSSFLRWLESINYPKIN